MKNLLKKYSIGSLLLVFLIVGLVSCEKDTPECYEPSDVRAFISYKTVTTRTIDTLIDSTIVDTTIITIGDTAFKNLTALSLGVDSPIQIFAATNSSSLGLFLNPKRDSTRYKITFNESDTTTHYLTLFHKSSPQFVSNDCGYTYYYFIDSVRYNTIDSVSVSINNITRDQTKPAIYLFFKN